MFGGRPSGYGPRPQGDMWAFDLKTRTWTELKPAGVTPSPRSNPSMVYAPDRQQIVLFGGLTGQGPSAETWRYDLAANTWTQVGTQQGPSARSSQGMSYDAAKGRVLLFGGKTGDTNSMELWEWQF